MAARNRKTYEILQKEIENGKALVESAKNGDLKTVKQLLNNDTQVNADEYNRSLFYASKNYVTPLQCAAANGHTDCVQLLLHHNADLDIRDRFDVTAVHMAAENGHYACLRLLLDAGADCNVATKYSKHGSYTAVPHIGGTTAIHLATKNGHERCVKELILNGADYNAVDEQGRTSLYMAAQAAQPDSVLIHLRYAIGRDILSLPVKKSGDTPLHECVRHNMVECVRELLKHGSDVNHLNTNGHSALHLSVHNRETFSFEMVKLLVTCGFNADVNLPDSTGASLLHYVSFSDNPKQERRPEVAAFLIAYGAEFLRIKNKHGYTLLKQELRSVDADKTILSAIIKSQVDLPSLEDLGMFYRLYDMQRFELARKKEFYNAKCEWYQNIRKNPRSLQHYCRCAVRLTLGICRLKHIYNLPLPTTLKEYLMLEYDEYR